MSQVLPGQTLRPADYEPVEEGLRRFVNDLLFRPLAQIWREEVGRRLEYTNSAASDRTSLLAALRAGRLQYSVDAKGRGVFSGESSAALGRSLRALGATFDSRERVYRLKPGQVPAEVLAAGSVHAAACERAHQRMERFLAGVQGSIDRAVARLDPAALHADAAVSRVTSSFSDAVKRVGIPFEAPDAAARAALSAAYTHNAQRWVKRWVAQDVVRLRHQVEQNARTGARASTLAARISARYDVSISKARFLARQETGLFMSAYHKEQYVGAGVPRYVWRTSHDSDVRPVAGDSPEHGNHRYLDGRVFTWAEGAPAKYMSSGKNCNPHEDYCCRCGAAPLVDTAYNAKFKVGDKYVKAEA